MLFRKKRRDMPQVNITPLIDVVLQLLLFFMVSTTFMTQTGIRIDLPKASQTVKNIAQESNTIVISADNSIYINRQQIENIEQLRTVLVELQQKQDSELIIIKADENVAHGIVVSVMDLAKTCGFSRIAIATR